MHKNKKILLFTESLGSGGAERQLVGLAVALKEHGYDVSVMTYIENQFYEPQLRKNDISYVFCKGAGNRILRLYRLAKAVRRIKPDTVISFLSAPNKTMCLLKPLSGFRLIVSERNSTQVWGGYEKVLFWLYRLADVVVANSVFECENIKTHSPALRAKTVAITNFVDTSHFVPCSHVENEVPVILCVGRILEQKNVLRFLDAVKILKDKGLKFVVKWYGDQSRRDYHSLVIQKLHALQLQDVCHFYEPSPDIVQVYQSSDIFCLPSVREGYPNVICEAMSCELPVACSNVCENPQIVRDGVNGFLFDPDDAEETADVIGRLLRMAVCDRKAMGVVNRQQVIGNNSIEAFCQKYIDIL